MVSGCVTFYQINKFFVKILFFHYWQSYFAGCSLEIPVLQKGNRCEEVKRSKCFFSSLGKERNRRDVLHIKCKIHTTQFRKRQKQRTRVKIFWEGKSRWHSLEETHAARPLHLQFPKLNNILRQGKLSKLPILQSNSNAFYKIFITKTSLHSNMAHFVEQ